MSAAYVTKIRRDVILIVNGEQGSISKEEVVAYLQSYSGTRRQNINENINTYNQPPTYV